MRFTTASYSHRLRVCCLGLFFAALTLNAAAAAPRWTPEAAKQWMAGHGWLVGCNYVPASAVNPLEMWQADTFDAEAIDRELGWAHGIGFNSVRVFLHNLAWRQDPEAFLERFDRFLGLADKHRITVMPVFFDGCWKPNPHVGPQPPPRPRVHNSQWVQCPGVDQLGNPAARGELEAYVKSIIGRFRHDRRVVVWDLYNEPDGGESDKQALNLALLREAFTWAREMKPEQPLTVGVAVGVSDPAIPPSAVTAFAYEHSDVISFHSYDPLEKVRDLVVAAQQSGRPVLCTEYLARSVSSRFETILPYLKAQGVGAYNWGLVAGKTQTLYPWDSSQKNYEAEPEEWFHDVLRPDGTPFRESEIDLLRSLTVRDE